MRIRDAVHADAAALAVLAGQLGYPTDAAAMLARMAAVGAHDPGVSLVAVDGHDQPLGFARALPQHFLAEEPFAELAALVVADSARDRGVGAALLAAVEAWARDRGLPRVCLRSNVIRERAHRFYLREGYAEQKRQVVFAKRL